MLGGMIFRSFAFQSFYIVRPQEYRFAAFREARAQPRAEAMYFPKGTERLDLHLQHAEAVCSTMFFEDEPPSHKRFWKVKVRDYDHDLFLVTDVKEHVEFAKRFMAEVLDVPGAR